VLFRQHDICAQDKNETVLDLLIRHNIEVSYSCKSGHCQACLLKCIDGKLSSQAKAGIKDTLVAQQYFLACQQSAIDIHQVADVDSELLFHRARISKKNLLAENVLQLVLQAQQDFSYRAGQFINLKHPLGAIRSYSLASVPNEDGLLELHIKRKIRGTMTSWLFEHARVGDEIDIGQAMGNCFYTVKDLDMPLILIGSGTGAAPLLGIARDAIKHHHQGEIHFYHGAGNIDGLYLHNQLVTLAQNQQNFSYHPCISASQTAPGMVRGRCNDLAMAELNVEQQPRLYICGNTQMVKSTQTSAYLAGVPLQHIYTDPFEYKDLRSIPR
jgi:ferredoxin-NADP reductase/ferredoxin